MEELGCRVSSKYMSERQFHFLLEVILWGNEARVLRGSTCRSSQAALGTGTVRISKTTGQFVLFGLTKRENGSRGPKSAAIMSLFPVPNSAKIGVISIRLAKREILGNRYKSTVYLSKSIRLKASNEFRSKISR